MRHQIPLLFNNLHFQYFIMNKLLEMKKKLLGQQAGNDTSESPTKIKKDAEETPQKDVSFEADSPPKEKQSNQKNIKTDQIAEENPQQDKNEKDQEEEEDISQQQPQNKQNLQIEQQNVERQKEPELQQNIDENIEEGQIQKEANVKKGEKQDLKLNVEAHQYEPNLQLNDKNPNLSCSIDEEQRNVMNQEEGQIQFPESKQEKKQKKIILKELQLINKSTKNLKESLKGLQIIQKKIELDPHLKDRLKIYLEELKVLQQGRQTQQNE